LIKKHLQIPDFITRTQGSITDNEEVLVSTASGKLTFKSAVYKKVEIHNVTVGQWISANSRIFDLLSPTMSYSQIVAYSEYTKQIGDLLDLYSTASVMLLDDEHRRLVNFSGRPWDDISLHLERLHLKAKLPNSIPSNVANSVTSVSTGKKAAKKSNNPCYGFNSKAGCQNGENCAFKHVCSYRVSGVLCREKHAKFEHLQFQTPAL